MEKYIDVKELSQNLSVKPMTIYGWIHDGMIPHVKLGKLVRFRVKEIDEWLEKKRKVSRTSRILDIGPDGLS
jgi:excisionase family DNA binding protein